jgi:hypothetical protein
MAWLDKLLGRGTSREIEETVEAPVPPRPSNPPLLLLVSDASGMAAFRLMRFDDAAAACEYVEFWRPSSNAGTVYAIWGLPGEPDASWADSPEQRGEAVVLVRDDRQLDVVYPFSFLGFESAWAFIRDEIEKELDPNRMMVYWAVPVSIEVDHQGKTHMSPDAPPPCVPGSALAQADGETPEAAPVGLPGSIFAIDEEAAKRTFAGKGDEVLANTGETEREVDARQEEVRDEPATVEAEQEPIEALPELVVERFGTPFHGDEFTEAPALEQEAVKANGNGTNGASKHQEGAPEEPVADRAETEEVKAEPAKKKRAKSAKGRRTKSKAKKQVKQAEVSAANDGEKRTPEPAKPAANERAVNGNGRHSHIASQSETDAYTSNETEPWTAHEPVQPTANGHAANGNGQKPEPERAQAAANGNEPWIAHTPVQPTTDGHAANGNGQSGSNQDIDLAEEITKVLEGRKLTQQEGPFTGFNSPPGRF